MERILIADDSLTSRMILLRCLEMAGLRAGEILQAKDGKEALALALEKRPDLIIADLNMPLMGGEQLLAALKSDPGLQGKPVLIVSSALNPARAALLTSMGACGTLVKPVSPAGIRTALAAFFDPRAEGGSHG